MMFLTMTGFVALGVDLSQWMTQKRSLQTAADAAALAGAYELANERSSDDAIAAALQEAQNNGYDPSASSASIDTDIDLNGNGTGLATVQVTIRTAATGWFSGLLSDSAVITGVTATAEERLDGDGQYCMLALATTGTAITTSGTVTVDANGCGVAANSDSSAALAMNGNVTVNVGAVNLTGDYDTSGNVNFNYESIKTNTGQHTADPYADFVPDAAPSTCTAGQQAAGPTSVSGTTTLNPGVYCGGISLSGNGTVTLNPGVYYIDGGSFSSSGNGSLVGDDVTLIFTNSGGSSYGTYGSMNFTGGRNVNLAAPTTGTQAGIVIYQDRLSPSTCVSRVYGNGAIQLDGTVYAPTCAFRFGGTSAVTSSDDVCTSIVSSTIVYHGTPTIGTNCEGKGVRGIGSTVTVHLAN